jgi:hypothetical protein
MSIHKDSSARHDLATIELRIREIKQLFNSLDATPFPATDLDADAEEFMLDWAMEFRSDAPLRIRIHIEHAPQHCSKLKQHCTVSLLIARISCGGGFDDSCPEAD